MATKEERDRLIIVEQQLISLSNKVDDNHRNSNTGIMRLETAINSMNKKLDVVIKEKADKATVCDIEKDVNQLKVDLAINAWKIAAIAATLSAVGISLLNYILKRIGG